MSLQTSRTYFTALLARFIMYANALPGISVALDEGKITSPRPMWLLQGSSFVKTVLKDAVHEPTSFHYDGLAVDLLVYRDGVYIADGSDPIWQTLDNYARSLNSWFGLGISFRDPNHLSYGEHQTPLPGSSVA